MKGDKNGAIFDSRLTEEMVLSYWRLRREIFTPDLSGQTRDQNLSVPSRLCALAVMTNTDGGFFLSIE
jgi:hypothetical protein